MKRLLPLLLILLLLLAACGKQPDTAANNNTETSAESSDQGEPRADESAFPPEQTAGAAEPDAPAQEGPDENELPIMTDGPIAPVDGVPAIGGGTVTLDGISSYLRVDLPEGWTWEQAGGTAEGTVYGLWPEDDPDFKVELHCWPDKFAMCGTGVTFQDYMLPNGQKATLATEEIGDELNWILILPESPDAFTIQFCVKTELYEAHRAELELLLGTIRQGVRAELTVVTPELADG